MTQFKKAVQEERQTPTFSPEDGYKVLPEWDAWVAAKGRHLELKRRVVHIGGQVMTVEAGMESSGSAFRQIHLREAAPHPCLSSCSNGREEGWLAYGRSIC